LAYLVRSGDIDFSAFHSQKSISETGNVIDLGEKIDPSAILFQSGYLTVEKVDSSGGDDTYFLKIPNLEVKAGLIPLLLSLKPFQKPLNAWKHAKTMVSSLNKLDGEGFQNAFSNYLGGFAYSDHLADEGHYHSLFRAAMLLVGVDPKMEVAVGDGRYDASYEAPDGTQFVIEMKYCPLDMPDGQKDPKETQKMKKKADEAMEQIDVKKYTLPSRGTGHDVYKVALVVGGWTEIFVEFREKR
jgi:hypothetical protein